MRSYLGFVVGEAVEDEAFFLHGPVQVNGALVGVVVEVQVEALAVQRLFEGNWGLDLPQPHLLEVYVGKERMGSQLNCSFLKTQPFLRLDLEEPFQQRLGFWREILRNGYGFGGYFLEDFGLVGRVEGRPSSEHVVQQRALSG